MRDPSCCQLVLILGEGAQERELFFVFAAVDTEAAEVPAGVRLQPQLMP